MNHQSLRVANLPKMQITETCAEPKIEIIQADMCDFELKKRADFGFIMTVSLDTESNERFLSLLDSVATREHPFDLQCSV